MSAVAVGFGKIQFHYMHHFLVVRSLVQHRIKRIGYKKELTPELSGRSASKPERFSTLTMHSISYGMTALE